jgi:large subunit ribosomal protein L17
MHRHGYKGKKFGRERDGRRALLKSLAESLVLQEKIETTLPKAKAVVTYTEKLITKAKKGDLHSRRQIIASLSTLDAANKLVDELAPKLGARNSGYLRIKRGGLRRGDAAQMATVSFVDDLGKAAAKKATTKKAASAKEEVADKEVKSTAKRPTTTKVQTKASGSVQAAKRTGRRGNR